jgi:hypothetical protein
MERRSKLARDVVVDVALTERRFCAEVTMCFRQYSGLIECQVSHVLHGRLGRLGFSFGFRVKRAAGSDPAWWSVVLLKSAWSMRRRGSGQTTAQSRLGGRPF